MALHWLLSFSIYEFLGKDSEVFSRCILKSFEFSIVLLIDWLPPKFIQPKSPSLLEHSYVSLGRSWLSTASSLFLLCVDCHYFLRKIAW